MSSDINLPEDVTEALRFITEARDRPHLTKADKENLNRAKLRLAYWACRTENIMASRENLTYILGADAAEIMSSYDRYLEKKEEEAGAAGSGAARDDKKKTRKKSGSGSGFWENA